MITSAQCMARFGDPTRDDQRLQFERQWMTIWIPPPGIGAFPRRIYCHQYMVPVLHDLHDRIVDARIVDQIKTWDGCFNVRAKKGAKSLSLHSWGLAFDMNASWNRFGEVPTMSPALVACIEQAGFLWGGRWKNPDGMHSELPALATNA